MDKPVEIMRIIRVPPMGKLVVQIGKRQFVSLDEIDNPKARQIILAALGELVSFGGGYEQIVDAGFAPPLVPPAPAAPIDASTSAPTAAPPPQAEPTLEEKQAAFLASLERGDTPTLDEEFSPAVPASQNDGATEQRKLSFFNRRGRRTRSEISDEPLVPRLDIAGELNEILQRHVAADPELSKQDIVIETNPTGGVRIKVNGEYYEDAATIADPMVRMAIKLATREWEENSSTR